MTKTEQNLLHFLTNLPRGVKTTLKRLKSDGKKLRDRDDLIWHLLLLSMSTMGNSRGRENLIDNKANYNRVAWPGNASWRYPGKLTVDGIFLSAVKSGCYTGGD